MSQDQLTGLVALKTVADTLNFTAAADSLGVSPSAVSQTIKQLEKRLGVALLARTTRSTSLTEAGERFLAQAGPALDQVLTALEDVGSYAKQPSGLLRLNLPRAIYAFHVAPLITKFTAKHPQITVELFFEDQQSDIVKKGFDAGIRLSDILAKDVVAIKLYGPVRFVTFAAPRYLNRMGRPKHPKDLLAHNCIRLRLGAGLYDGWEFAYKGKEFQVQVKGSLIMNDSLLMLEAAADGAGIGYATEDAVREKVKAGKLEVILSPYACSSAGFYLYYPRRHQVLPKLRAFIESIRPESTR
jgi:DNA-binding transcriptional LysR family regulator